MVSSVHLLLLFLFGTTEISADFSSRRAASYRNRPLRLLAGDSDSQSRLCFFPNSTFSAECHGDATQVFHPHDLGGTDCIYRSSVNGSLALNLGPDLDSQCCHAVRLFSYLAEVVLSSWESRSESPEFRSPNGTLKCLWGSCVDKFSRSPVPYWTLHRWLHELAKGGGLETVNHPWSLNGVLPDYVAFEAARKVMTDGDSSCLDNAVRNKRSSTTIDSSTSSGVVGRETYFESVVADTWRALALLQPSTVCFFSNGTRSVNCDPSAEIVLGPDVCRNVEFNLVDPVSPVVYYIFGKRAAAIPHCCAAMRNMFFLAWFASGAEDSARYSHVFEEVAIPCQLPQCLTPESLSKHEFWVFAEKRANVSSEICHAGSFAHPPGHNYFMPDEDLTAFYEEILFGNNEQCLSVIREDVQNATTWRTPMSQWVDPWMVSIIRKMRTRLPGLASGAHRSPEEIAPDAVVTSSCDPGWVEADGQCYKAFAESYFTEVAAENCIALGGCLATPSTVKQFEALSTAIAKASDDLTYVQSGFKATPTACSGDHLDRGGAGNMLFTPEIYSAQPPFISYDGSFVPPLHFWCGRGDTGRKFIGGRQPVCHTKSEKEKYFLFFEKVDGGLCSHTGSLSGTAVAIHNSYACAKPIKPWKSVMRTTRTIVRIGGVAHFSSEDFLAARLSWEAVRFQINERHGGLLVNGTRYPIDKFVFLDDRNDPERHRSLLEGMLDRDSDTFAGLDFIWGPIGSNMTKITKEIATKYNKIVLAHAWADDLFERDSVRGNWVLSPWPAMSNWVTEPLTSLSKVARDGPEGKPPTIVFARPSHKREVFPFEMCEAAKVAATQLGFNILGDLEYDPWDPDRHFSLPSQVAALAPDIYFACGQYQDAIAMGVLMNEFRISGFEPKAIVQTMKQKHGIEDSELDVMRVEYPRYVVDGQSFWRPGDIAESLDVLTIDTSWRFDSASTTNSSAPLVDDVFTSMGEFLSVRETFSDTPFYGVSQKNYSHLGEHAAQFSTKEIHFYTQAGLSLLALRKAVESVNSFDSVEVRDWFLRDGNIVDTFLGPLQFSDSAEGEESRILVGAQPATSLVVSQAAAERGPLILPSVSDEIGALWQLQEEDLLNPTWVPVERVSLSSESLVYPRRTREQRLNAVISCRGGFEPSDHDARTREGVAVQPRCRACQPGYARDQWAATMCSPCTPGTFSRDSRSLVCTDCPTDSFSDSAASTKCSSCSSGTSTHSRTGQSMCSPLLGPGEIAAIGCASFVGLLLLFVCVESHRPNTRMTHKSMFNLRCYSLELPKD